MACNKLQRTFNSLQLRHNERDGVLNHQPHGRLVKAQINENIKAPHHRVGNSPVTGEFPAQRASNTENVSIWWRHYVKIIQVNAF